MISNKIFTKDDKKELANFLFQCLSYGVSKERINNLAQAWLKLKQDGRDKNRGLVVTLHEYKDKELDREMAYTTIFGTLPLAILFGLMAGAGKGEKAVIVTMGIFAGLAAVAFLASVGYLINQHVGDKEYANAYVEGMADAYSIECLEAMQTRCQELENDVKTYVILQMNLSIIELFLRVSSCPNLPLNDAQFTQFVINAPLKSNDSVVIYK